MSGERGLVGVARARLAYRPAEAAEMLSISRSELYARMGRGEIRSYHEGRGRRIAHDELVRYLEAKQQDPQ